MVLELLRENSRRIALVLGSLLILGGLVLVGLGPASNFLFPEDKPVPDGTVSFEKKYEGNNINVEVTFKNATNMSNTTNTTNDTNTTNTTAAEKIVVEKVGEPNSSQTIHRVNSHVTFEDLEHGDKLKAYAVVGNTSRQIDSYTVYVNRNPHATFSATQEYNENQDSYTVTAVLEQAPAIDYVTAVSTGEFTSDSGDSQDYDGDGDTKDDINIVQKQIEVSGVDAGSSVIFVGYVDGKAGIVDTFTVTEPTQPEAPGNTSDELSQPVSPEEP